MGGTAPRGHPGGPDSWPTDCVVYCEDPPTGAATSMPGAIRVVAQQEQPQGAAAVGAQHRPAHVSHTGSSPLSRASSSASSIHRSSLERKPSVEAGPAWSGMQVATATKPGKTSCSSGMAGVAPLEVHTLGNLRGTSNTSHGSTPTSSAAASPHPIISPSSSNGDLSYAGGSMDSATPLSAAAGVNPASRQGAAPAAAAAGVSKPRTYYIDWLRVFLTLVVVIHHCVSTYTSTWTAWAAKPGDTALWLLSELFVVGNQTYFMTLFFFVSGIYVPGSFRRKGPMRFLFDRTLRLVLPCLVYSLIIPPMMVYLVDTAKNPTTHRPLSRAFADWFAPVWPTRYLLPTGPPWFLWMLWWFNVAYVILASLSKQVMRIRAVAKLAAAWQKKDTAAADAVANKAQLVERDVPADVEACRIAAVSPRAAAQAPRKAASAAPLEYTQRQCLLGGGMLIVLLVSVMFTARAVLWTAFKLRPSTFFSYGPFVAFMPDYFFVYAIGFTLGIFSGPSAWNVLPRLPASWAGWLLCFGGVWWALAGFLLNVTMRNLANPALNPASTFLGVWALRTFTEQAFAVVWSFGLLILFREAFNVRPAWLGQRIISGAYAAYLVHMPIVMVLARALMSLAFPSAVLNAVAIMLPAVVSAWVVAAAIRAIPGADWVL